MIDVILEQVPADGAEADEDEHALHVDPLAPAVVIEVDPFDVAVPADFGDDGGRDRRDLLHSEEAVLEDRLCAEVVTPMHQVELLGEPREEQALLER